MTIKQSLVSIGIPCYNNQAHIKKAVQSIVTQTYKHIEIIISDDASSDNTFSICQAVAKHDKRIRLYRQPKNHGPAKNFTFTLNKAKGKFFLWASGDDFRDPACVASLVKLLEANPRCTLAISNMRQFNTSIHRDETPALQTYSHTMQAAKTLLLHPDYASLMVLGMYRTTTIKKLGGYHQDNRPLFQGASDFITAYKVSLQGDLGYINKPLLHKRDSGFFLSKYQILRTGHIPLAFVKRTKRYLLFPIYFFWDFYYSLYYSIKSPLRGSQKVMLLVYCTMRYALDHLRYITTILGGVYAYGIGFVNIHRKEYSSAV